VGSSLLGAIRSYGWVVLAVWRVLTASVAAAQPAEDGDSDAQARVVFEQGRDAYENGRFEEALLLFRRAHGLSANPVLLYNVALAADRLRRDADALDAYEQYLAAVPDAPQRASVQARIEILRAAVASRERAEEPPPAPLLAPEPPPASGPGALPWIVVGTGGAFVAGGVILVVLALGDVRSVEDAPAHSSWADYESAAGRAPVLSTVGFVLGGIGLVALGGGLVWALGSSGETAPRASLGLDGARLEVAF
jgi:tetratricopeptide (TPR) repeat protein